MLETLKGIESINGFKVVEISERTDGKFQVDYVEGEQNPVLINHCDNSIQFFLQNGTVKEAGVNGCQVDTMIETAMIIISSLNEKFPCQENSEAINCLHGALTSLNNRKNRRVLRGIEGTSEEIK